MFASHRNLDNLVAILDHNHLQIDGRIEDVCCPDSFSARIRSFWLAGFSCVMATIWRQSLRRWSPRRARSRESRMRHRRDHEGQRRFVHGRPGRMARGKLPMPSRPSRPLPN